MKFHCNKIWLRRIAACGAACIISLCGAVRFYANRLPDRFDIAAGLPVTVSAALPVTLRADPSASPPAAELRLFGMIPVKTVALTDFGQTSVYIGGEPFGIRMLMAGVMVVSLSGIAAPDGSYCPAKEAGIRVGDVIRTVNGKPVGSNADLQAAVADSDGAPVSVVLMRGEQTLRVSVQPVYVPAAQRWQTGMWVRDSTAGIGTVTYYTRTPAGQITFAGLGHAVCDPDTGELIPLGSGDVITVSVNDIVSGSAGKPGELRGKFDVGERIGTLSANTECGIFGSLRRLPRKQIRAPLGCRQDISRGEAVIYTTVDGTAPQAYSVEIEEIRGEDAAMRNLVIHVTDPALLEATGGIVQGMSGSPILQNGRLIGAVTHVFIKDPTRGYGIFAENMYAQTADLAAAAA